MRVIRYREEDIEQFSHRGLWTDETFFDFWERNAREIGSREALVDSKYRLTWAEALRTRSVKPFASIVSLSS